MIIGTPSNHGGSPVGVRAGFNASGSKLNAMPGRCDEGRCAGPGWWRLRAEGGKTLERIWKNQPYGAGFGRFHRTRPDVQKEQSLTCLPAGQGLYLLVMKLQE
jgi:hypothetical protein